MSKINLKALYKNYQQYCTYIDQVNLKLTRQIRKPNFPEAISENIVVNILGKDHIWSTTKGDITNKKGHVIEVKCSKNSLSPISFGPTIKWDRLVLVKIIDEKITVYNVDSTKSNFLQVMVNKSESFSDQCKSKRRPRITLTNLLKQIEYTVLYDGPIDNVL